MTSKKKQEEKPLPQLTDAEKVLNVFLWECGDCKNIYTMNVFHCPNKELDEFIVQGIVKGVR